MIKLSVTILFAAEDLAKFSALLDQALAGPSSRDSLRAQLGVSPLPPAEPKAVSEAIDEMVYLLVDKCTRAAGTWQ